MSSRSKTSRRTTPDEYFDFIYVDGFAHGDEEDGRTFTQGFPKVRKGGVFGGHDYDEHWPKVVSSVDRFLASNNLRLFRVKGAEGERFGSWFTIRPK